MNISKQVIILSAERTTNAPEQNAQVTEILKGCLLDCNIAFNEAVGVFNNGPAEASLVAIVNSQTEIEVVTDFAFKNFNQDAIVLQDANQEAHLITKEGTTERLGRLELVSKEVALDKGSYTLLNGQYYTTIPRKS